MPNEVANVEPWLKDSLGLLASGDHTRALARLRPHLQQSALVSGLMSSDSSPLSVLVQVEPHVHTQVVSALTAGDVSGALRVAAVALGAPTWAVDGLLALSTGGVDGARAAIMSSAGSGGSSAYVRLALDHALNASGVPYDVLLVPEVQAGVLSGNVSRVVHGLAGHYGLPTWSADALVAMSTGGSSQPSSGGGLGALLGGSGASTSSRLADVLSSFNVSEQLSALGMLGEYESYVNAGDVEQLVSLLALTAESEVVSGRRLSSAGAANVTALGRALARIVPVVTAASQLERALRDEDVGLAISAVVTVLGEHDSPLGRSLAVGCGWAGRDDGPPPCLGSPER